MMQYLNGCKYYRGCRSVDVVDLQAVVDLKVVDLFDSSVWMTAVKSVVVVVVVVVVVGHRLGAWAVGSGSLPPGLR